MTAATQTADGAKLVNEAVAAFKARDRDRAALLLARAIQQNPPLGNSWGSVSRLAATIGEVTLALTAARRQIAANPTPDSRLAYAQLLSQSGRSEAARDEAGALARERPNDPAALHLYATSLVQLGDEAGAEAILRRIIALPTVALGAENAWHVLADMKKFAPGDPDVAAMEALLARIGDSASTRQSRIVLLYALGKAYDDQGEVDRAFASFDEAARLQKADSTFNPDLADRFVDAIVEGYDRAFMDSLPRGSTESDRPIFVLGLPRSGTTLVEQILVSHSQVTDGAEANLFRPASMAIEGYTPAEVKASFDKAELGAAGRIGRA